MPDWTFMTNHGRAIVFIAKNPEARLRDIAAAIDVTERTAFGIINDLTTGGYVIKERQGRRNRYHLQSHLPLPDRPASSTIGEVLEILACE